MLWVMRCLMLSFALDGDVIGTLEIRFCNTCSSFASLLSTTAHFPLSLFALRTVERSTSWSANQIWAGLLLISASLLSADIKRLKVQSPGG